MRQTKDEKLAWKQYCQGCKHPRICHGPGGCGGMTLRGCVLRSCNCTKFVLGTQTEYDPKTRVHQVFGRYCQTVTGDVR